MSDTPSEHKPTKKQRIVVLGGGMSALAAVFGITHDPKWQEKYDIDVYQMGWRLGGKGASGRNLDKNARVEEHGLHIWFGFYQNAFHVMRQAYDELGRPPTAPLYDVDHAFQGQNLFSFMEKINGTWSNWRVPFPTNPAKPGLSTNPADPDDIGELPSLWDYTVMILQVIHDLFSNSSVIRQALSISQNPIRDAPKPNWWERLGQHLKSDLREAEVSLLELAFRLAQSLDKDPANHNAAHHHWLQWLIHEFRDWLRKEIAALCANDTELRHFWMVLELATTCLIGMLEDGVLFHGLVHLDKYEFTEWLLRYGCAQDAAYSTLTQSLYDSSFAYINGDQRCMAAGVAIRVIMRVLFTYKGSVLYKMNAGMGDTIFAPIYLVLKKRGVNFHYFHKIEEIKLDPNNQDRIGTIVLTKQADINSGQEYYPLVPIKDLPCWPSTPVWKYLVQGDYLKNHNIDLESRWADWAGVGKVTLTVDDQFDSVILGIPAAAFKDVCPEILLKHPNFQQAFDATKTVITTAIQLWFKPDQQAMKWVDQSDIISSYVEPYSSISNFSQLIDREEWSGDACSTIAYSCGVIKDDFEELPPPSDHDFPAKETLRSYDQGLAFVTNDTGSIWCGTDNPDGSFNWDSLAVGSETPAPAGPERFKDQYWRTNVDPTEQYDISPQGSTTHRIKPDQTGIDNLYVTGTWTDNGINISCIEAATISGLIVSRAISGYPQKIVGETDKL